MKALTLHQPYASLVAAGVKTIETRSWSTSHRGPLAIHAGVATNHWVKRNGRKGCNGCGDRFWDHLASPVPMGAVVATCNLVDVVQMGWLVDSRPTAYLTRHGERVDVTNQLQFGDWHVLRFAWLLEDIVPIEPVPARGRQQLWEWAA